MLTLALETGSRRASVVLADDDRELSARRAETDRSLCRRLASEVEQVVEAAGSGFGDIELVAVGLGPGSFTSMRVGMATAKAIAVARGVPLVGVPSLESMAWQLRERAPGLVCPLLDAGREEVYAAVYRAGGDSVEQIEKTFLADPGQLAERLLSQGGPVVVFGQTSRATMDEIRLAIGDTGRVLSEEVVLPDALALAQLGRRRYRRRGGDDVASLRPIYVRVSYAEERFDIDLGLR